MADKFNNNANSLIFSNSTTSATSTTTSTANNPDHGLVATCSCICAEIRQQLNAKIVEFALNHKELLHDGKLTIISIGSGALGQELSCSKALAEKGIGVNYILIDPCYTVSGKKLGGEDKNVTYTPISAENSAVLFKEFDAQKPADCKIIARFLSIHHYVLYMKSMYKNLNFSTRDLRSYQALCVKHKGETAKPQIWDLALDCYKSSASTDIFSAGVLGFTQEKLGEQGFPGFIMAFDLNENDNCYMSKNLKILTEAWNITTEPVYLHCEKSFISSSAILGGYSLVISNKIRAYPH